MTGTTRRTFGLLALFGLAGCQRSRGTTTTTSIGTIELLNERPVDETFHVVVEHDDTVAFWETHEVSGSDDQSINVAELEKKLPQGRSGALEIHARVGDAWDTTEIDGGCRHVGIWAEQQDATATDGETAVAIRVDDATNCG
jgi:hypothetical protein